MNSFVPGLASAAVSRSKYSRRHATVIVVPPLAHLCVARQDGVQRVVVRAPARARFGCTARSALACSAPASSAVRCSTGATVVVLHAALLRAARRPVAQHVAVQPAAGSARDAWRAVHWFAAHLRAVQLVAARAAVAVAALCCRSTSCSGRGAAVHCLHRFAPRANGWRHGGQRHCRVSRRRRRHRRTAAAAGGVQRAWGVVEHGQPCAAIHGARQRHALLLAAAAAAAATTTARAAATWRTHQLCLACNATNIESAPFTCTLNCPAHGKHPVWVKYLNLSHQHQKRLSLLSCNKLCFIAGWSWIKEVTSSNPVPVTRFLLFCTGVRWMTQTVALLVQIQEFCQAAQACRGRVLRVVRRVGLGLG